MSNNSPSTHFRERYGSNKFSFDDGLNTKSVIKLVLDQLHISAQPKLVAHGKHTVYRAKSSTADIAIRLIDASTPIENIQTELTIARLFSEAGLPVARPVSDVPIITDSDIITVWEWIEHSGQAISPKEHGALLRQFHDSKVSLPRVVTTIDLLEKEFVKTLRKAIAKSCLSSDNVRKKKILDIANERLIDARLWFDGQIDNSELVSLHGDYSPSNAIPGIDGMRIIDFEFSGMGPRILDFSMLPIGMQRYGWPKEAWECFCDGYGRDIAPSFKEAQLAAKVQELTYLLAAAYFCSRDLVGPAEFEKRLEVIEAPYSSPSLWSNNI